MAEISRREPAPPDHRLPPGRSETPATPAAGAARRPGSRAPARPVLAGNGRPGDPDSLRREIEATRARMTRTLDEIEVRLARQKEELVAKATFRDLRRKLSRDPWRAMAIAFVAGYVVAAIRD